MAADDAADELVGTLVDERYQILEAMASGSMGAVYKAERVPVGKLVAVKFLHASFSNDAEFLARFERETRVMSKLAHPNCVSVVDFGVWEGSPYLVMDYIAGTTLRALIDEHGALPPARALNLARQIAAGLAHAHKQDVVHRDVKPANIMISDEVGTGDHVRILDFGLARLRGAVGRDATQANVVVGTPNYMAPEQTVGGGHIDARTDIYACGVVLFEMVTGDRPFQAEDTLALLGMHRAAPIPKLADRVPVGTLLPAGLQAVIEKAMAKSPEDRYQTAIELASAIDAVATPSAASASSSSARDAAAIAPTMLHIAEPDPRERRSLAPVLAAVAVVALGGGALWYFKLRPTDTVAAPTPPPIDAPAAAEVAVAPPPPPSIDAPLILQAQVAPDAPLILQAQVAPDAPEPDAAPVPDDAAQVAIAPPPVDAAAEIEMDPATAEDLDPAQKPDQDDEEPGAPATAAEAEQKAPPAPVLASTLPEAMALIKAGKRDLAIASLRALWKASPNNANIPFLLGNLYYDQRWWSVAMDHYRAAITKADRYRWNPTLTKNVIRMLASPKTERKAAQFLRSTIGKPALPYVKQAAAHDANPTVKRAAAALAKQIK